MKKGYVLGIVALAIPMALSTFVTSAFYGHRVLSGGADSYTSRWGWNDLEMEEDGTITYHKRKYDSKEEAWAASKALALDIQEEGTTLLKNEGNALPLKEQERHISVFGTASVNMIYSGTGSGDSSDGARRIEFYDALSQAGFHPNPSLKSFYEEKAKQGYKRGDGTDMNGGYYGNKGTRNYGYSINEVESSQYLEVESSFAQYKDAAIIVIARSGGEGQDLPTSMKEFHEGNDKHYLELTDEEEALIKYIKGQGFSKTVLLLNTMNPFECGFLLDEEYGIDAALHIGSTGDYGMLAVAEILSGKRKASGRLSDTYAYDLLSAPTMQNYGDNRFLDNGRKTTCAYVAYSESIYNGYRYYETRYEDSIKEQGNAGFFDYGSEVVYPFGYGLNYSDFSYENLTYSESGENILVSVDVTNIGSVKDKDTLEFFLQKPYSEGDAELGIEKASVELVDFVKTDTLEPGERKTYQVEFPKSEFASYDAKEKRTYRMDAGTYYITLGKNAHQAINNILSKQGIPLHDAQSQFEGDATLALEYVQTEDLLFSSSSKTGFGITNQFETGSYTSVGPNQTFLTRSNWLSSWPKPYGNKKAGNDEVEFTQEVKQTVLDTGDTSHLGPNNEGIDYIYNKSTHEMEEVKIGKPITSSSKGIHFMDLIDEEGNPLPYDDPKWQELVESLSEEELYHFLSWGGGFIDQLPTINKKISRISDAPLGFHRGGTVYPCYPIQAATFSKELAHRLGEAMAEEANWMNFRGWWAPTGNIHRHPFGGRSYEYYSEDGVLGGKYGASIVKSAQNMGIFCQVKHFALNDQDTNRGDRGNYKNDDPYNGLVTYVNEQTAREVYLRAFQYLIEDGGAHGVMTSYNRIGHTWAGGHYGLLTNVLRNEWGMEGSALTDYAGTFGYKYMNMKQGLRAGNDIWLHPSRSFPIEEYSSDATVYYMQKAAKHVLYAEANTSRVNDMRYANGEEVTVRPIFYMWRLLLAVIYSSVMLVCAVPMVFLIRAGIRNSKSKK